MSRKLRIEGREMRESKEIQTEITKSYYYFDEAGDPNILGRKGINLIEKGFASKVFMVGYLETKNPKKLAKTLENLRQSIISDEYLKEIPSIKKTANMFHATDDCPEVRSEVFNQHNMNNAVNSAVRIFEEKWKKKNESNIRIFIQQTNEITLLQAADYVLWTIQRAYQNNDFRYYNYLKDKICLVHDIFDFEKYPNNYYTQKNPLEAKKIDQYKARLLSQRMARRPLSP